MHIILETTELHNFRFSDARKSKAISGVMRVNEKF